MRTGDAQPIKGQSKRDAPDGDGIGAGISKIIFFACLSHSQATAYLLQRMQGGLVVNDVERGNTYYRTTPRGVDTFLRST